MQNRDKKEIEISFKYIMSLLLRYKLLFLVLFILITSVTYFFMNMKQQKTSYISELTFEVGEGILSRDSSFQILDNIHDLKYILRKKFKVEVIVPRKSKKIFTIHVKGNSIPKIEEKMSQAVVFLKQRHKEKALFFSRYIETKQLGDIKTRQVSDDSKKVKLQVFSSLLLGMFVSFLLIILVDILRKSNR